MAAQPATTDTTPRRLSAAGIQSFMKHGGVLMLYKKGCRHCDAIYRHNDEHCVMSKVDSSLRGSGRFACVANGPRNHSQLPGVLKQRLKTYPAIFVHRTDSTELYERERTPDAITRAALGEPAPASSSAREGAFTPSGSTRTMR